MTADFYRDDAKQCTLLAYWSQNVDHEAERQAIEDGSGDAAGRQKGESLKTGRRTPES